MFELRLLVILGMPTDAYFAVEEINADENLCSSKMNDWMVSYWARTTLSDQEINDLFKRFIARPVMVIVDVRAQVQVVGMLPVSPNNYWLALLLLSIRFVQILYF
jgi:hypothetical protein